MTQQQAELYEAALIDLNMLAPPKPTGRIAKDDPFAAIADKIRTGAQIPVPGQPIDDQLAKQGSQAINKAKAKQAAKQTKKQAKSKPAKSAKINRG